MDYLQQAESSVLNRIPKVAVKKKALTRKGEKTITSLVPAYQAVEYGQLDLYYTNLFLNVPSNLFANNGARFTSNLYAGSFETLKGATLKATVTVNSASAVLAPMSYWFNRIECRGNGGSGDYLHILYDDNLNSNLSVLDNDRLHQILPNANYSDNWGERNSLAAGQSRTFYLPLVGSVFDNSNLMVQHLNSDILFDFYPASTIVVSGSGTVTCQELSLVCNTEELTDLDKQEHEKIHANFVNTSGYIDVVPITFPAQLLTAGIQTKLDISNIRGKCAYFDLIIRAQSSSNTDNGRLKYVSIGDNTGTLDILDAGSKSVWGSGQALHGRFVRGEVWASHHSSDFAQNRAFYRIPFCADVVSAFKGVRDGFIELSDEKYYLSIMPSAAGVAPIITATPSGTATSGAFRLSFDGQFTSVIAYNETAANIKIALEALSSFRNSFVGTPLTVTVSGPLTASATFTFGQSFNLQGRMINVHSEGMFIGATPLTVNIPTAETTVGQAGFTTGTYDISIYAGVHKALHYSSGNIAVELL